ncbi:MAG: 4-hydroxy-tetrahydrodipicolinate synthase [Verrucomicrobiia bacterium Tous-C2TDCM]|nr:MAG: 4-hydroxy-tetrahydrodipicolinate synthase [Verrucomicrobiae bacterium Tous-C2TDCM]
MFEGAHTALVTPFNDKGMIDPDAFRALIDQQFENGIKGIVPCGTTGESSTLSTEEHHLVIEMAVKQTRKRGLVIAGTGSNSTREAIDLTQAAEKAGADAALLVTPYYNKPSQEGLYQHYKAIALSTDLPLMLYSIPGRCHIQIDVETCVRLATDCPNIKAIKEAGGVTERVRQLRAALPAAFEILSGDDALTVDFMKEGAVGVVSVAGNLIPGPMADLTRSMLEKRVGEAEAIHSNYAPLFNAFLKIDTNPVPIKAALGLAGVCRPKLRLPMVEMSAEKVEELREALVAVGLL